MFTDNPMMQTFFSAVITMIFIAVVVRIYLSGVSKKRPKIQKPDWMKERDGEL